MLSNTYIAQICYYDPQSVGINVQSPQSATTPKRLTLGRMQEEKLCTITLEIASNFFITWSLAFSTQTTFHEIGKVHIF